MRTLVAAVLAALSLAPAMAAQAPETPLMTGPNFQQVPSSQIQVLINGTPTALGAALAAAGCTTGCTASGPFNTTSATGYQQFGQTLISVSGAASNQAMWAGPGSAASAPANPTFFAAFGTGTLQNVTGNWEDSAFGTFACQMLTTAQMATCLGMHAGGFETTNGNFTASGTDAMRDTVGAGSSVAYGNAAYRDGAGTWNGAFGTQALQGNATSITFTGPVTVGDVLSLTFASSSPNVTNFPATASYTVKTGDTLTLIASGLAASINALSPHPQGQGVLLTAAVSLFSGGPATIGMQFPGSATTGWAVTTTSACTGTCTETVTIAGGFTGTLNDTSGYQAMFGTGLTTAQQNSIHGANSAPFLTSGSGNSGNGAGVFAALQSGGGNVADGNQACNTIVTGAGNGCYGSQAQVPNASGGAANNQVSFHNFMYGVGMSGRNSTVSPGQIGFGIMAPTATITVSDAGGTAPQGTHISVVQTTPPSIANGTLDTHASDVSGTVTLTAANPVVTFTKAFATAPHCAVSSPSGSAFTYSVSTTALTLTGGASGNTANYVCFQ